MNKPNHFRMIDERTIQYHLGNTLAFLERFACENYNPKFKFYDEDIEILKRLFVYNINDFETCKLLNIDPTKGILLIGPVGCGKTTLMKVFNHLAHKNRKYTLLTSREVAIEYGKNGFDVIDKYGLARRLYCFDDLGTEQITNHFGNECNTLGEIIINRYEKLQTQGIVTHLTTNLNADELEKIYGNRVRSRLREMFNLISFPESAMDKRK